MTNQGLEDESAPIMREFKVHCVVEFFLLGVRVNFSRIIGSGDSCGMFCFITSQCF